MIDKIEKLISQSFRPETNSPGSESLCAFPDGQELPFEGLLTQGAGVQHSIQDCLETVFQDPRRKRHTRVHSAQQVPCYYSPFSYTSILH